MKAPPRAQPGNHILVAPWANVGSAGEPGASQWLFPCGLHPLHHPKHSCAGASPSPTGGCMARPPHRCPGFTADRVRALAVDLRSTVQQIEATRVQQSFAGWSG